MTFKKILAVILTICMITALFPTVIGADENGQPLGDINTDGKLNTADATLILKFSASMFFPTEEQLKYADSNLDGYINTADATLILQICAGMKEPNYAHDKFMISFSSGSISESAAATPVSMEAKPGDNIVITFVAVAAGHDFRGWVADFDGCLYSMGDSFIMPEKDVVLTALWDNEQAPSPSGNPTGEPTAEPTATPTQPPAGNPHVTFAFYDYFNETSVVNTNVELTDGTYTYDAHNIELPEGYKLKNNTFQTTVTVQNGVVTPPVVNVEVYHAAQIEGRDFYVIDNIKGFEKVREKLSGNYLLNCDIDLGGQMFVPIGWNDTSVDCLISDFTGIFDGNNHTISNIYMDYCTDPNNYLGGTRDGYGFYRDVALFACNEGIIRNLNAQTGMPTDEGDFGLWGDCNVGMIAGWNGKEIVNCHCLGNVGSIYCGDNLQYGSGGGICGNNNGTIKYCGFEGGVEGFSYIGGIAGKNFGIVEECYFAGGINGALIDDPNYVWSYSIFGIGGICGAVSKNGASGGIVRNCYAYLTYYVIGNTFVGGLVGIGYSGSVETSYVVHSDRVAWVESNGGALVGGFANSGGPQITNCYDLEAETGLGELPYGFSSSIWDMNGACYGLLPDLINNRRPSFWMDEEY